MRDMSSILQNKFPDIKIDIPGLEPGESRGANFLFFMCSLIFGMVWITYITFFNSRVVGKVLTRIANRFVGDGYVKVRTMRGTQLKLQSHDFIFCSARLDLSPGLCFRAR